MLNSDNQSENTIQLFLNKKQASLHKQIKEACL